MKIKEFLKDKSKIAMLIADPAYSWDPEPFTITAPISCINSTVCVSKPDALLIAEIGFLPGDDECCETPVYLLEKQEDGSIIISCGFSSSLSSYPQTFTKDELNDIEFYDAFAYGIKGEYRFNYNEYMRKLIIKQCH